jgi:hypothetical protein
MGYEPTQKTMKAPKTAAVNETEPNGSSAVDKKACDGKWHDYKASSGQHGWKVIFHLHGEVYAVAPKAVPKD